MYSGSFFSRNLLRLIFTAPIFYEVVHISQLLFNLVRIGIRLVNLIDSEHNGNTGCRSMIDGLHSLGHYIVVGSDDNNGDIGHLSSAGTHSRKCLVTRSIEESDTTSIFQFHIICTDMLSDTSGFPGNHIRIANIVEQ